MWESCRNVHNGCKLPFLVRRLDIPSTGPVDGDGGLGVVPYVALALIEAVLRPNRQAWGSYNCDFGLCGSLDGRDFRLVVHLDADNGAELATFGEAADEAVAEDVSESFVIHLRYRVKGHLFGNWGGFVGHFDGDDVVEVRLVDFVFIDNGGAAGAFDRAVFDGGAGGDVQRLHYVGDVVDHARGVSDDLDDVLVWRCQFGWLDCCCGDGESVGNRGGVSGRR